MAIGHLEEEQSRLAEHCEEFNKDRAALDEGAGLWNDVVTKVSEFESTLQSQMQQPNLDRSGLLAQIQGTTEFLEAKLAYANSQSWNLLVCAIGAEVEAFKQGKAILEQTLGPSRMGKEKVSLLVDTDTSSHAESDDEVTSPSRRGSRSPANAPDTSERRFFDNDNPDPDLLISHHDTDTD